MRALILFFFIFLCGANAFSQTNCNCESEYKFVVGYIEKNLLGFHDNVNDSNRDFYKKFKDSLFVEAKQTNSRQECFRLLDTYVEFFLDAHTSIFDFPPIVNENDSTSLNSFLKSDVFLQTKQFAIDENTLLQMPVDSIEGVYYSQDSVYKIGITKAPMPNLYYAVILKSNALTWKPGQVKLELTKKEDGSWKVKTYMRNHSIEIFDNAVFTNGRLAATSKWLKVGLLQTKFNDASTAPYSFKEIDKETNYINIKSFDGSYFTKLDSFYKSLSHKIYSKPYLIIDVRNNGGGSTNCALPLVEYFFSKKIVDTTYAQHYATPDIIARYEEVYKGMRKNEKEFGKKNVENFKKELEKLKKAKLYSFYPKKGSKEVIKFPNHPLPLKVAILYNKGCASACEDLLFYAMHPSKAVLMGENSGGYTGYGNVFPIKTPCMGFIMEVTTTRYSWNQRQYDSKGIPPQYYLKNDEDWVLQAMKILKQGE